MDYNINVLLAIVFIGGLIGWSLFVYIALGIIKCRRAELNLIDDLRNEITEIRKEVNSLK